MRRRGRRSRTDTRTASSPFHVIVKPRGPICNLNCAYCYYLAKADLYPGSDFRMGHDLLEQFTRQYIAAQPADVVTFGWQGGEPLLMGLDFFRRAVELQEEYRPDDVRIVNALQTNGTLLNDAWCDFFREHDVLVGLSLDGPAGLHDAYRKDTRGRGTFDCVMQGLSLLKKHDVAFNILTCVHAANADHPLQVYRFLRDQVGALFIQFIPIVEPAPIAADGGELVSDRSVAPSQYGRFLIDIFDEWLARDMGRVSVQLFEVAMAAWLGQPPGLCVFDETCGRALVLEHNGDLYACDHFVDPQHRLGNIRDTPLVTLVESRQQWRFGMAKRAALPRRCRECELLFVCHGGCPKNRLVPVEGGQRTVNYLCEGYKAFFSYVDQPMSALADQRQDRRSVTGPRAT